MTHRPSRHLCTRISLFSIFLNSWVFGCSYLRTILAWSSSSRARHRPLCNEEVFARSSSDFAGLIVISDTLCLCIFLKSLLCLFLILGFASFRGPDWFSVWPEIQVHFAFISFYLFRDPMKFGVLAWLFPNNDKGG